MDEITLDASWRERFERLVGRRRAVWVVAAVLLGAMLIALLLYGDGPAPEIAPPAAAQATPPPPSTGADGASITGSSNGALLVHVAGAVRRPGLYEMDAGARVADAIEAAGGPRNRADLDALNLAQPLVDGAKVLVLRRGAAPPSGIPSESEGAVPAPGSVISINTADQATLETIPGIGPAKAAAIIEQRELTGGFTAIEQLLEVSGIGPATLESIRPYVGL